MAGPGPKVKQRKKYSINVEDGKLVSVEVDGVEYLNADDIPGEDDRQVVQWLVMGTPDIVAGEADEADGPSKAFAALPSVVLWIFGGVAALMLVITLVAAISTSRALSREVSAPGRVVDLIPVAGSDGGILYRPVIDFTGVDNERYIVPAGSASRPPAYDVGEPVEIRYDPADPETARVASFWGNVGQYTLALITGVLAIAFLGATVLVQWINRQDTGKPSR
jgi:hypothetical protein